MFRRTEEFRDRIEEYFGCPLKDHEGTILFVMDYRDRFSAVQRLDRLKLEATGEDEHNLEYSAECPICGEHIIFKVLRKSKVSKCDHCGLTLKSF